MAKPLNGRLLELADEVTKLEREAWPMRFIAAVVRRAAEASPSAVLLERMHQLGYTKGRGAGLYEERAKQQDRIKKALAPLLPLYRSHPRRGYETDVPLEWVVQEFQRMAAELAPSAAEAT